MSPSGSPRFLDSPPSVQRSGRWSLEAPVDNPNSLVVPAGDLVLKLNAPSHVDAEHEADALAQWNGRSAVRLLARDDERRALLIERCVPGTRLWDASADEVGGNRGADPKASDRAWTRPLPSRFSPTRPTAGPRTCRAGTQLRRAVRARSARSSAGRLPNRRPLRAIARQPGPARRERAERATRAVARHRPEAARRGARARVQRAPPERPSPSLAGSTPSRSSASTASAARGWGVAHNVAWAWDERRGWLDGPIEEARRILNAR